MKKIIATASVAALMTLGLSACGAAPTDSAKTAEGNGTAAAPSNFRACMVSDEGGFDDKSFNQSGYEGLERAKKELGIEINTVESSNPADYEPNLEKLAAEKCNLIFGVGFSLAQATYDAAVKNPEIHYALIDATEPFDKDGKPLPSLPNFKPLVFNTAEAGFLAGYVAAGMTKTGAIGTYLGKKFPTTMIFADGLVDGVERYNADNGTTVTVKGWDKAKQDGQATGDFSDQNKGKATTTNLISQGADIIMPVAGPVGAGTLAAVKEANAAGKSASVIWVDADGVLTNPDSKDIILTSVMKQIGESVFEVVKESKSGVPFDSKPYIGSLANKGVDIAPFHEFESKVPTELKDKVDELRKQIASGELKVETPNAPK